MEILQVLQCASLVIRALCTVGRTTIVSTVVSLAAVRPSGTAAVKPDGWPPHAAVCIPIAEFRNLVNRTGEPSVFGKKVADGRRGEGREGWLGEYWGEAGEVYRLLSPRASPALLRSWT